MINFIPFCWNSFQVNGYLLYNEQGEGWLIDAGISTEQELARFEEELQYNNITLTRILLTHGHVDHVCGCGYLYNKYRIVPELHPDDFFLYRSAPQQGEMFGLHVGDLPDVMPLKTGEITFGASSVGMIHLPGHSPGSLGFYLPDEKRCFVGDVIFNQGIGRTDLPGGSYQELMESISRKILDGMDNDTMLLPGHGTPTTVGNEKRQNPFRLDFAI